MSAPSDTRGGSGPRGEGTVVQRRVHPLRRALDTLYLAGGIAGACFIVAIGLLILAQIIGRLFDQNIPGSDDLTAFSVAASAFLALAYSFRRGAHIRVTLLIDRLTGRPRQVLEVVCLVIAIWFIGWLTWGAFDLVGDSLRWNDRAQGLLPIPMWIPQLGMAVGALLFLIALIDDLVTGLRHGRFSYAGATPDLAEGKPASPARER